MTMFIEQKLKLTSDETEFVCRKLHEILAGLNCSRPAATEHVNSICEEIQIIADKAFHFGIDQSSAK